MENIKKDIPKILLDTDIGSDCDDAGAFAMLHRLCSRGECELLAVTACYETPYIAGCIDAINRYYGRPVPVGILHGRPPAEGGVYTQQLCQEFENSYPPENTDKVPGSVYVMRSVLACQEDKSVTLVAIGSMSTVAALLESQADEISPLSGRELIEKKVLRTVVMGGRFSGTWPMLPVEPEWNIKADIPAARIMCRDLPGELVFSSSEIGSWCVTMKGYSQTAPLEDPIRRAYELHSRGRQFGRESWDHTALLYAIRPEAGYWNLHPYGRIQVDEEGVTTWHRDLNCKHTYLIPRMDYSEIRDVINGIVFQ